MISPYKIVTTVEGMSEQTSFYANDGYALNIGAGINDGIKFLVTKKINDFYGNGRNWDKALVSDDAMARYLELFLDDILYFSRYFTKNSLSIEHAIIDNNGRSHHFSISTTSQFQNS